MSTIASRQVEPLISFLARLKTIVETNDLNHYKTSHKAPETLHKIHKLKKYLALSPLISYAFTDSQLTVVLFSLFAAKDVNKAYVLLIFLSLGNGNQLITNELTYKHAYAFAKNNEIKLAGMDNWNSVLCYLDSLIFAMFGRIDDYDNSLMVSDEVDSPLINEFKLNLRLLVNLMRSGESNITTDLVQVFCTIFAELGFKEAISKKQQDVVSCFEILCDYLRVPLLTLKIDIIHSGKVDINDDLKYMSERVLFISVPEEKINDLKSDTINEEEVEVNKLSFSKIMKGKLTKKEKDAVINLEECLNNYFNNSIKVKRVLQRRRTLTLERAATSASQMNSRRSYEVTPESTNSTALEDSVTLENGSNADTLSDSDADLLSEEDLKERNEFLGIVSFTNEIVEPVPIEGMKPNLMYSKSRSSHRSAGSSMNRSVDDASPFSPGSDDEAINIASSSADNIQAHNYGKDILLRSRSSPIVAQNGFKTTPLRHSRRDSMSKISEIITQTRSRSATDASTAQTAMIRRANSAALSHTPNSAHEVTLPAWMFLQLLPYYTDFGSDDIDDLKKENGRDRFMSDEKLSVELVENVSTSNDESVAPAPEAPAEATRRFNPVRKAYTNKRPIVPICLKRYIYNDSGKTQKINKKFNIPTVIEMPYFVADSKPTDLNHDGTNKPFDHFRLVLESVVCHRGNSVDSGHYVAAARKFPYIPSKSKKNKEEEQVWLLFNDLKDTDEKTTETTFKQILDTEAPYLLFYRIEECDPDASEGDQSSYTTIKKVDTENSMISQSSLFKDKTFLDRLSTGTIADSRDLRKNSTISTLSQVSSVKKELQDELKLTSASTATPQQAVQMQPPGSKGSVEGVIEDSKNSRHSHHFSFTRSLSRSSSRPPPAKREIMPPDNAEFIEYTDKYYWYYETAEGTFKKQTKFNDTRSSFPTLQVPVYKTESIVSDSSEVTDETVAAKQELATVERNDVASLKPAKSAASHLVEVPTIKTSSVTESSLSTKNVASPAVTISAAKSPSTPSQKPVVAASAADTKKVKKSPSKIKLGKKSHSHSGKHGHDDKCVIV